MTSIGEMVEHVAELLYEFLPEYEEIENRG